MKTTYEIMDQEEWFEELSQEEFHSIHHCMEEYANEVLEATRQELYKSWYISADTVDKIMETVKKQMMV